MHTQVLRVLRMVYDGVASTRHRLTDHAVLSAVGLPVPLNMMRFIRFNFLVKIIMNPNAVLLKMLFAARGASRSWLSGMVADMHLNTAHGAALASMVGACMADSGWADSEVFGFV